MFSIKTFATWGLLSASASAQGVLSQFDNPPDLLWPREPYSPYSYPSPNATGAGGWQLAIQKAKRFVAQLTIEEKASLCTGNGNP